MMSGTCVRIGLGVFELSGCVVNGWWGMHAQCGWRSGCGVVREQRACNKWEQRSVKCV